MRPHSLLRLDPAAAAAAIEAAVRDIVFRQFRRKGAVVAVSGGIDSAVVAALCARALGKDRVLALLLPERESSPDSTRLGQLLGARLGIETRVEDITPILEAAGCYRRRDEAVRRVVPGYGEGFRCKVVLPEPGAGAAYPIFSVVTRDPDGAVSKTRLTYESYLEIVAATNFKQRTRKMMEYFYADRHHYAVAGTPNRLEYDQGFFVKNGDGAADFKPIAHLYKSQVYQLAAFLGLPEEILVRPPSTDTYPLEQSQEEFYFTVPLETMDLCLYGKNHGWTVEAIAAAAGLEPAVAGQVCAQIDGKRRMARYLHSPPLLVPEAPDAGSEPGTLESKQS